MLIEEQVLDGLQSRIKLWTYWFALSTLDLLLVKVRQAKFILSYAHFAGIQTLGEEYTDVWLQSRRVGRVPPRVVR